MDRSDVDRLRSLAAMFKPLAELPAMLDRALSADQAVREAEMKAAKIAEENLDTMQAAARIRDEIKAAQEASKRTEAETQEKCAKMLRDADARVKSLVDNAHSAAKEILLSANDKADYAMRQANSIDQSIADKRAEVARLDDKIAKAKEYLKKIAGD